MRIYSPSDDIGHRRNVGNQLSAEIRKALAMQGFLTNLTRALCIHMMKSSSNARLAGTIVLHMTSKNQLTSRKSGSKWGVHWSSGEQRDALKDSRNLQFYKVGL